MSALTSPRLILGPILYVAAAMTACATETDDDGSETTQACSAPAGLCYSAEMTQTGTIYSLRLDLADPGPPVRGDQNVWTVTVLDSTGKAADCDLSVEADMPAHGHGTTPPPEAHPLDGIGQFEIRPLNLFMPGLWEVVFELSCDGTEDRVVYPFWIES